MNIQLDDLSHPAIAAFLESHLQDMRAVSPPESKHALDLDSLRQPEIAFYTAWEQDELIGCAALKKLTQTHGEIKSMRTAPNRRGQGIASQLLQHLLDEARKMKLTRLSLETGSMPFFKPARSLYQKYGFTTCPPFATYREDPNSTFMTQEL